MIEHIMYIDDQAVLRALVGAKLSQMFGVQAKIFDNAVSALQDILENPGKYDIIASDYQMLGMDGLEFFEALKRAGEAYHQNVLRVLVSSVGGGENEGAVKRELMERAAEVDAEFVVRPKSGLLSRFERDFYAAFERHQGSRLYVPRGSPLEVRL